MSTFTSLGIKWVERRFAGKKVKNFEVLVDKPIKILDFQICPSKKNLDHDYVKLQLLFKNQKRFVTTGAKLLVSVLSQINVKDIVNDPISTIIKKKGGCYYFKGTLKDPIE